MAGKPVNQFPLCYSQDGSLSWGDLVENNVRNISLCSSVKQCLYRVSVFHVYFYKYNKFVCRMVSIDGKRY